MIGWIRTRKWEHNVRILIIRKEGRREGRMEGGREGEREGGKEGRRDGDA